MFRFTKSSCKSQKVHRSMNFVHKLATLIITPRARMRSKGLEIGVVYIYIMYICVQKILK